MTGIGMLAGSVIGGYVAQVTSLGVPFVMRRSFCWRCSFCRMGDEGPRFKPHKASTFGEMIDHPEFDRLRLAVLRSSGIMRLLHRRGRDLYTFYALQPYLLSWSETRMPTASPASPLRW